MTDKVHCAPYGYNPSTVVPVEQPEPEAEEEEEELDPVAGALFEDVVHAMKRKKYENRPYISFKNHFISVFLGGSCVLW